MPGTKGGHLSDDAQSRVWHPTLYTVLVDDVARPRRWLLGLNMSADCHQNYGAPSQVFVDINVTSSNFEATVTILDKTGYPAARSCVHYLQPEGRRKLGQQRDLAWVSPKQCDRRRPTWFAASPCLRGAVTWHAGWGSWRRRQFARRVARRWLALLRRGYHIPHHRWHHQCRPSTIRATRPSVAHGASWNLWNNLWG